MVRGNLQLGLDLPELPTGKDLDVGADLFPCSCLACPQLDVPGYQLVPSVHLSLVRQDDLTPSTWRVDCQRLHEGLLNLRSPDTLGVLCACVLVVVKFAGVILGNLAGNCLRNSRKPDRIIALENRNMNNRLKKQNIASNDHEMSNV